MAIRRLWNALTCRVCRRARRTLRALRAGTVTIEWS